MTVYSKVSDSLESSTVEYGARESLEYKNASRS